MNSWVVNVPFDGKKFATRYGLDSLNGDFSMHGNVLTVWPDHKITDNPPIFEAPDPIIPAPAGIWVHEMRALSKKIGSKLIDGDGSSCFHIVVETEAKLSDPWLQGVSIDTGSTAYLMDKAKTVVWDGTKWK